MKRQRFPDLRPPTWDLDKLTDVDFSPTLACPGSDAKVLVMADRYARGLPVFHPRDNAPDNYRDDYNALPVRPGDDSPRPGRRSTKADSRVAAGINIPSPSEECPDNAV